MGIKYKIANGFFVIGIMCFISFEYIGSEVDEKGYLIESFALVPLGWLFMSSAVCFYLWGFKKKK
ncbi:MAG: hypothetical protein CMC31_00870 [Flavobacteriaceae bacterium]|mgnify:FL=1|nr:hypothetical protein [Flavobacteriaceae bacterium]